jgi:O-antigen/teichoic acid export membrane protein
VSFAGRVRRGFLWNQITRTIEMGSAYLASVLAARAFGAVEFGTYSVALSLVSLGTLATSLGLNEVLNVHVPRLAGMPGRVAWLLRSVLRLRAALALAVACALFLAAPWIAGAWRNPALELVLQAGAIYVFFYQVSLLLEYFLLGQLDVPRVSRVRVAVQLLNLAAAFAALRLHLAPRQLILAMACNAALGVAWLAWGARASLRGAAERFDLAPVMRFGLALWATNFVNFFVGRQADILLIGLFRPGSDQAGAYSAATLLATLLAGALLIGTDGVTLAAFSEVESRVDRVGLGRLWALHVKMDVLLSLPLLAFGARFAREIVSVLYGAGFERAAGLLAAYAAVWIAARALGGGTNMAVLYAMNEPRLPLVIYGACAALNLAGDLILIPRLGAPGAVIATGAAMLCAGLASGLVIRRRTGAFFPVVFALKVLAASALGALLASILPRPPGLAGLLVAAAVVGVVTLVGLRLLRPLDEDDRRLLIKLSPRLQWLVARL